MLISQSCIIFALAYTLVRKLRINTEVEQPNNLPPKSEFRRKMTARCIGIPLSQCHKSLGPHTKTTQKTHPVKLENNNPFIHHPKKKSCKSRLSKS